MLEENRRIVGVFQCLERETCGLATAMHWRHVICRHSGADPLGIASGFPTAEL